MERLGEFSGEVKLGSVWALIVSEGFYPVI